MENADIEKLRLKILVDQFLKTEVAFLIFSLVCGCVIAYGMGIQIGFKMFLLFFLVPQPFLLYANRDLIGSAYRKHVKKSE